MYQKVTSVPLKSGNLIGKHNLGKRTSFIDGINEVCINHGLSIFHGPGLVSYFQAYFFIFKIIQMPIVVDLIENRILECLSQRCDLFFPRSMRIYSGRRWKFVDCENGLNSIKSLPAIFLCVVFQKVWVVQKIFISSMQESVHVFVSFELRNSEKYFSR